ncbi:MAG TPA: LuxR C-terminal-related transcriptional regulator [Solirubrobacterales bacterium]|nr:LuxR C-terminal-related transcriptional regulator [Solirubrobacterales bacterium]
MIKKGDATVQPGEAPPHPPGHRSPLVQRLRLLGKLEETSAPIVVLDAPSGYGKSVLIEQWAAQDPRPFLSLLLGDEHNDPAMLVGSILAALEEIEPVPPEVGVALANPDPSIENVVLPRLGAALEQRQVPFVLVLDDFERIDSPRSLAAVSMIMGRLPASSQIVLATRTEPALALGRIRAHRGLAELGREDLVMTKSECQELLAALGLVLSPKQLDTMIARTEGWPAALYLAGLALTEAPDLGRAISRFAGDDRFVVDYIRDEFLVPVSRRRLDFLRRASVLDRLSGELCDSVLERSGSAAALRDLSHSNMLLTPLDRRDEWFRFHPLFREMLRAELRRIEPEKEAELNRRASDWWVAAGDWDRAIAHAVDGGDMGRAGELLWMGIPEYTTRGRNATVIGWLDHLGEQSVATDAALSLTASYAYITQGAGGKTEHWAAVAAGLIEREEPSDKKNVLTAGLALIEAALARDGVEALADRTAIAAEMLPDDSPWMSMCRLIEGVGLHMRGLRADAHEKLIDGARRGAVGAPNVQVLCLSQLALLAMEEGDWTLADVLASQARAQVDRSGLGDYPMMALALAVSALVRSRTGRIEEAAADLRRGSVLLEQLDEFPPWYEGETWVALARTAARLDDAPAATKMLVEAARVLKLTPDAIVLGDWIEQTALAIDTVSTSAIRDLTPAELRVLQFLPTHLSFPEIAGQVFVSPNTVKTQAQGVYRKLGVTSRRAAVEEARAAGLLDAEGPSQDTAPR